MPDTAPEVAADTPEARANAALVLEFFEVVLGPIHDGDALPRFLAATFLDHDPAGDDAGLPGVGAKLAGLWAALPDGRYVPDAVVAADELVTVRSRLVAPATGSAPAISVPFADTYRVVDGLIREHWHVVDATALGAALASRTLPTRSPELG
jgi:predicted SnoaL-like aldol condensation-catalyzing enzyme